MFASTFWDWGQGNCTANSDADQQLAHVCALTTHLRDDEDDDRDMINIHQSADEMVMMLWFTCGD